MHDLIIRGGTIADGSGRPTVTGDVAIDGSIVTEVGAGLRALTRGGRPPRSRTTSTTRPTSAPSAPRR